MALTPLGDYDSELVTLTLTGIKFGKVIVPVHFGPDERVSVSPRTFASTLEGQGGAVIRNRYHPGSSTFTISLLGLDEANRQLSEDAKNGEIYDIEMVDNNGEAIAVSGKCWVQEEAPWAKAKDSTPQVWTMGIKVDDLNHGQLAIV